ncbi:MAG: hypothetical protein K2G93_01385 [Rikenella sp.]|nr:hypothetical protein [Rikenella sp.]
MIYPAPGLRGYNNGTLWGVGRTWYGWSSTVTGTLAHFLNFDYGGVHPNSHNYRPYGFPLRCLQE